eukprot:CAMPEP_0184745728 /NCGR_PEP_ID=MMETSP0315-20130426/8416_1 /TAXON_ID=101924 /ORGANISM="Rhodosorus marinus, Strain UTEX LB 2760" /LENGTH=144 /DNA_ID=CAMNT_0027218049 /DNA_START=324 /DNA_END=758 /DNA_ORIENTATION=+
MGVIPTPPDIRAIFLGTSSLSMKGLKSPPIPVNVTSNPSSALSWSQLETTPPGLRLTLISNVTSPLVAEFVVSDNVQVLVKSPNSATWKSKLAYWPGRNCTGLGARNRNVATESLSFTTLTSLTCTGNGPARFFDCSCPAISGL